MYIDDKTARELLKITKEEWEAILNLSRTMLKLKLNEGVQQQKCNPQNEINEEERIRIRIKQLLKKIGLPPHLIGHDYLEEAIYMRYTDDQYKHYITKGLYPHLAKKLGTTPSRIERAIRHSVEYAYSNGNVEVLHEIFTGTNYAKGKPTNAHAIAALTEYLRMHNV